MLNFIKSITSWKIWAFIASAFLVLLGLIKVSRIKNKSLQETINDKEIELKVEQKNSEVKEFQAVNIHKKIELEEVVKNGKNITPNTDYHF